MSLFQDYKSLVLNHEWNQDLLKQVRAIVAEDESKMEPFTLPSVVKDTKDAMDWMTNKRPKLLKFFSDNVYGRILPRPQSLSFEVLSIKEDALNNTAIRKEIRIHSENNGKSHAFDCLLYIPKNATKPVPAFAGLNFRGNQLTIDELDVRRSGLVPENEANHDKRATQKDLWCFRETVARGYASITACYHDIFPDNAAAWDRSALTLFDNVDGFKGCHEHYTSIGVWAWGLSRMLDYLESDPLIDASQVAVHGLSRLGKTALWAGATDQRFKMVVSNCSGCGGAALSRRLLGENLFIMHTVFPHWLVKNIEQFIGHEDTATFDQHELLELAAPRLLAVASATADSWADPHGEFLSAKAASEVYRLFGSEGLPAETDPAPDQYVTGHISYHIRTGVHSQQPLDWGHYLQIADKYFVK